MRTRAVWAGSSGGRTKAVSLKLNSAASACISASDMPRVRDFREPVAAEAAAREHVDGDGGVGPHRGIAHDVSAPRAFLEGPGVPERLFGLALDLVRIKADVPHLC